MPRWRRDAALNEGRGDALQLRYSGRPYLGEHRSKLGRPRISARLTEFTGGVASPRRKMVDVRAVEF
jgi:hypothetical protein